MACGALLRLTNIYAATFQPEGPEWEGYRAEQKTQARRMSVALLQNMRDQAQGTSQQSYLGYFVPIGDTTEAILQDGEDGLGSSSVCFTPLVP
jgi:hypothetical protein